LRKVLLVSADEVNIRSFELERFIRRPGEKEQQSKVSKKVLKNVAKELGLHYSDEEIHNIKKLIEVYRDKR